MSIRRHVFIGAAAMLGFGIAGGPALAWADSAPSGSAPTVTQDASGTFTVALPGVGSLSFSVDPTSGALTGVTVTPVDGSGFTAGTPTVTAEGVQVLFTSATTSEVLQVEVEQGAGAPQVSAETEIVNPAEGDQAETQGTEDGADGSSTTGTEDGGSSTSSDDGQDGTTTTTTTVPPSGSTDDSSGSDGSGDGSGGASSTTATTTPTSTTGTTSTTSGDSGDSGSSGGSGSDGGSGSSGSDG